MEEEKKWRLHAGLTIDETARAYGITQKELARKMGMSQKHISELTQGKTPISPKVAVLLEEIFGASAQFWLNLQANCDIRNIKENIK